VSVRVSDLGTENVGLVADTGIIDRSLYVDPFFGDDVLLSIQSGDGIIGQIQISRADFIGLAENLYLVTKNFL